MGINARMMQPKSRLISRIIQGRHMTLIPPNKCMDLVMHILNARILALIALTSTLRIPLVVGERGVVFVVRVHEEEHEVGAEGLVGVGQGFEGFFVVGYGFGLELRGGWVPKGFEPAVELCHISIMHLYSPIFQTPTLNLVLSKITG